MRVAKAEVYPTSAPQLYPQTNFRDPYKYIYMMTFQIVPSLNLLHLRAKRAYISLAVRNHYYPEELVEMRSCQVALIVKTKDLSEPCDESHT